MKKISLFLVFVCGLMAVTAQVPEIDWVFVKGGEFWMGCTEEQRRDCQPNEMPTHQVVLKDYYISKYEVTQAQWTAVMGYNHSKVQGDSLPVTRVNWYEARDFALRLSAMTGQKYRVPTEAEWEYAARGGSQSKQYRFSGSDNINEVAWYRKNSGRSPQPVGLLKPNELGIYDMSGNVYEWCFDGIDFYNAYFGEALYDPQGNPWHSVKVCRGGGMTSFSDVCRVSARSANDEYQRLNYVGFRLVREVTE